MGKGKSKGKGDKKVQEKKVKKVVEDKTFGLKNKNKSKKVQQYIKQVNAQARGGKTEAQMRAAAAEKKRAKEAAKQAELEMFALLGKQIGATKKGKKKMREEEQEKKAKQQEKEKKDYERDFGIPISTLNQVFQCDSKAIVPRVCGVLVHKDNLITKNKDGTECLLVKIDDGTTLKPLILTLFGETPSTFAPKVGNVLDVRNAIAMVRGERVALEIAKGSGGSYSVASENLSKHVRELKEEQEELRAQGGIPIEELIEQQRAELKADDLTPVTKERFFEWKLKKKKAKEEQWEKDRKAAAKKSGGKGLNVLSGKALFTYDPTLFKDDEGALDNGEYDVVEEDENAEQGAAKTDESSKANDVAVVDGVAVKLQEDLYLNEGENLDDLDDLE